MKLMNFFAFILLFCGINSCNKKTENLETNYLIFGHFYGLCQGETCIETYKLTDTKLFEDTKDAYSNYSNYAFVELSNAKFNQVADLLQNFPEALLQEPDNAFGCPDCLDQGGIVIQYTKDGYTRTWLLDNFENNVPNYLHDFQGNIKDKIELINN